MLNRATAGVIAGFPLALAVASLWVATGIGDWNFRLTIALILSLPLWWLVALLTYRLPPNWRAWAWLLAANLVAFGVVRLCHLLGLLSPPA